MIREFLFPGIQVNTRFDKYSTSIFKAENNKETSRQQQQQFYHLPFHAGLLLGTLFNPENVSDMFLRNIR
jgi:hypothetical protein